MLDSVDGREVVKVQYEHTPKGGGIKAMKVTLDESGRIIEIDGYLIRPGDLPLDFKPSNSLTAP